MKNILCFGDSNTYGLRPDNGIDMVVISAGQEFFQRSLVPPTTELLRKGCVEGLQCLRIGQESAETVHYIFQYF